ncbi:DNA circularization N-terminal domain-containing protein [Roseomonas chloroacetimidivorans]|uniref:DNA circularization N-terminal domain-containing protein n=1 Tax=Roseomonas chloroacetimidivorans TaxID=1766656 RepID=UPI003C795B31
MAFADTLLAASWRGIEFGVRASEYARGRRVAVHQYPYRDDIWAEDLGRAGRIIGFSGFLVGDDVGFRAQQMLDAAELKGAGTLVHPLLGAMEVVLVAPLRASDRMELGRVVEIQFQFVEARDPEYPSAATSTQALVQGAADACMASCIADFGADIGKAIDQGVSVAQATVATVNGYVSQVNGVLRDAAMFSNAVSGLVPAAGTYGRYATGARVRLMGGVTSVSGALSQVTRARTTVTNAASKAVRLANSL